MEPYLEFLNAHADFVQSFRIDSLDRTGVPVVSASAWGATTAHGVGYGETEVEAARSAYGECVESLAGLRYARRVQPVALDIEQAAARGAVLPDTLSPVAGTSTPDGELLWVEARTLGGDKRLVPLEAAVTNAKEWSIAAGERVPAFPPITNGQGAAFAGDRLRAVRHGLCEVLQRDVNWSQFKALDTGRVVASKGIVEVALDVRLKYAGQAFGVHSFHASAAETDETLAPITRTSTGEGADPDPRVAARKAVLELCSSRCRKQFFFTAEALRVAPSSYRERMVPSKTPLQEHGWNLTDRFDALLGDATALQRVTDKITHVSEVVAMPPPYPTTAPLERLGAEILVIDMTEPGDAAHVVKVVVPGLEAEVLSHHRIGPRALERLTLRLPQVVHQGDSPGPGWRHAAGAWVDVDALRALAEPFLPLYREPDRHAYVSTNPE